MAALDLVLGIDSSTQGTSAVILDRATFTKVAEARVRYRDDPRLARYGLGGETPILPPREPGEAQQPAALFLDALDALLADLPADLLRRVAAVDLSAQQHGQVWLGEAAVAGISALGRPGAGARGMPSLAERIGPGLSWDRAPIWMSANTIAEAAELREASGGSDDMTARSGSDSPLRFSGAVLMHSARRFPEIWARTRRFHLISSFLSGVLSANPNCPIDWGNGSGTSLMNWRGRRWDSGLISTAARSMGVTMEALTAAIPPLAHPLTEAGSLASYFVERFGLSPDCRVLIGSGDNPQSKVLASGTLLSLGTSFVLMAEADFPHVSANAMYDGLGNPFIFGCRTNGALAWERVRRDHGLAHDDFAASEKALGGQAPGFNVRILQTDRESFPDSPIVEEGGRPDFAEDYAGVVDSSLGLTYLAARRFAHVGASMAVTGGGAASPGVLLRIASIWKTAVLPIANAGAAGGAALAAALALTPSEGWKAVLEPARKAASGAGSPVAPDPRFVEAYHGKDGYLSRLEARVLELGFRF